MTADLGSIVQSPNDKRCYKRLVLDNGLVCLLIQDPEMQATLAAQKQNAETGGDAQMTDAGQHNKEEETDEDEEGDEDEEEDDDEDQAEGSADMDEDKPTERGEGDQGPVKKAAAAMAVGIGSFSDPDNLPGLSHYLEHMLFMGSAAFPDENDYDAFLTRNGGSNNAYTETEVTNYHFEVQAGSLRGALERFAQFFIAPLCLEGSLEREVCAVDNEFTGVLQSDACRLGQMIAHTASQGHIYRKFMWGNKKSLWELPQQSGVQVRDELMAYYKKHYSAERMTLVMLGGEPLDTLEGWARELFSAVPAGCGPRPTFEAAGPPFQGRWMHLARAVKDLHQVHLSFPLPCLHKAYANKPDHYLSHLVGHEGAGSLLSALKARGWASELSAGISESGFDMSSAAYIFTITITLTEAGLAAAPGLGLGPVALAFQYLNMLRNTDPQEWVWQELKAMAEMKFRFAEEEEAMEYVTRLAAGLHLVEPAHALVAEYLHEKWDPDMVRQLLAYMHPTQSSYRIDLLTKAYADVKQQLPTLGATIATDTEPWFGMELQSTQLPEQLLSSWAEGPVPPELHLPPRNPYLPTDFAVRDLPAGLPTAEEVAAQLGLSMVLATPPQQLLDEPGLRLWYKQDISFRVPKVAAYLRIGSVPAFASPRNAALTSLLVKLAEDQLNEDAYLADVAGLHYNISAEPVSGVDVRVDGFSHKLPLLVQRIVQCLAGLQVDGKRFGPVKEALLRKYRNFNMQVGKAATYYRVQALSSASWDYELVLAELEGLTAADVQAFVSELFSECCAECLLHGNLTSEEALQLAGAVRSLLGPGCRMSASSRPMDRCVRMPTGANFIHSLPAKNPDEENSAIELYFQADLAIATPDRAMVDLVDQLVYEPLWNTLRTKEQLGYSVGSGARLTHGVMGFCVVIVSGSHAPPYLEQRAEAFLEAFQEKLQAMSEEEFSTNRSSLIASKLVKDRSSGEEAQRHWEAVSSARYDFLGREMEVAALQAITLTEVQAWYRTHLAPSSPGRRKFAVHIIPHKASVASNGAATPALAWQPPMSPAAPVEDLAAWKRSMELYPGRAATPAATKHTS